jgi:hypothetical protein
LLPGVLAPEEDEDDEDIPPEDEFAGGGDCANSAEAINMLATDVAIPT